MIVRILFRVLLFLCLIFIILMGIKYIIIVPARKAGMIDKGKKEAPVVELKQKVWKSHHSVVGNFKVLAPADMHHVTEQVPVSEEDARLITYDMYICQDEDDIVYSVTSVRYPPTLFRSVNYGMMLEEIMNEIINDEPGNILQEYSITTYNELYPALDFVVEKETGQIEYYRSLVVYPLLYILSVTSEMEEVDRQLYMKFIDSFQVIQ